MTRKQKGFIESLLDQRDWSNLPFGQKSFLEDRANLDRLSVGQASNVIQLLLECPKIVKEVKPKEPTEDEAKVEKGYYFIVDPTDKVEKFFKVDKPDDGKWKGYTFLHVQASDDFFPIKSPEHRAAVIAEIAKDPITAMNEYGQRIGRCGRCHRTLTKKDSRLRGLGPICAGKVRKYHGVQLSMEDIQNLLSGEEDE